MVTALDATGGLVLAVDVTGDLSLVVERGLRDHGVAVPDTVRRGVGVLGGSLASPRLRRGRLGEPGLEPAPGEPGEGQLVVLPLHGAGAVVAVLALLRLDQAAAGAGARGFDDDDERALAAFAVQAQAGIETVLRLREAQRLAVTDELTGLWNARYLSLALTREVERASRFGHSLAVLMLDLDRFKAVNDAHGHARGDAVLRELARRLSREVRDVDVLARYGGEEFVVVAPETCADGAARLAARLVESVREAPVRRRPVRPWRSPSRSGWRSSRATAARRLC